MRQLSLLFLASTLAACARQPTTSPTGSLYERVASRLADRTDLEHLGEQPPEMSRVSWMVGTWDITTRVFATPSTPERIESGKSVISTALGGTWLQMADSYPTGTQDFGFVGYNPVTRLWVSTGLDNNGNAVQSVGKAWEGNHVAFVASNVEILGERVTLRQTVTQVSADEFTLLNEELRPDGSWLKLDEYRYRRAVTN